MCSGRAALGVDLEVESELGRSSQFVHRQILLLGLFAALSCRKEPAQHVQVRQSSRITLGI